MRERAGADRTPRRRLLIVLSECLVVVGAGDRIRTISSVSESQENRRIRI